MKKLSEVLSIQGSDISQKPELRLFTTPLDEITLEQRKSTEWVRDLGTIDEYMELWRRLGSKPNLEQQLQAFNVRFQRARQWLKSLPDYTCPHCLKSTLFEDGCGCLD
jgi:hypothetical protein